MKSLTLTLVLIGGVAIAGAARADISRLPPDVVAAIAALGPNLDPAIIAKTKALMDPLAPTTPPASVTVAKDVAYGDDPRRIVLVGHSAGANSVAAYVLDPSLHPKSGPGVAAAVLVSLPASRPSSIGKRDSVYFGADASLYRERASATHVDQSKLPLMLVTAEFDPVALAPDAYDLAAKVCVRDGKCPAFFYVKGHNHISEIGSVGSKDDQLARALVDFVRNAH